MDVCLPVCKVGFSVSSLQSGVLSLQTGAGRKRCDLHVSRSANCDTQFANWCSLQIRRASLASSLHTELSSRLICKLRPSLQTAAKVSPSLQTGLSLQTAPVRRLRPTHTPAALPPTNAYAPVATGLSVAPLLPVPPPRAPIPETCRRNSPPPSARLGPAGSPGAAPLLPSYSSTSPLSV